MNDSRRSNLLIAAALLLIGGSLALYALIIYGWLWARPAAPPAEKERSAEVSGGLAAARESYREDFLNPAAHVRLSEALFSAGRPIDGFYVMLAARRLFGDEEFARAHGRVALRRDSFLGPQAFDPSPDHEQRLKSRLQDDPENQALLLYLAHISAFRGAAVEAQRYLDAGLAAHPEDPELLAYKAEITSSTDTLSAIPFYARAVNAAPDSYEGRAALEELRRLGDRPESGPGAEVPRLAREAIDELYHARPAHPMIFSAQAMSLWQRGDLAAVRAMVFDARSRTASSAAAAQVDGALALHDHETDKAIRLFTEAWEANPEDLYSAAKLAQLYSKQRADPEAALPFYLALYRRNPEYDDGEPAERVIRETLDARRAALLNRAGSDALGRYLRSDDASLRAEACVKAAASRDPRWLDELAALLDDDDEIVRHNAEYALYELAQRAPAAVRAKRDEWLSGDRPLLKTRVLGLFADLSPQETYPLVLRALNDPRPAVRFLAKTSVLDRYYGGVPAARRAGAEYAAAEKDPSVLALYRIGAAREER